MSMYFLLGRYKVNIKSLLKGTGGHIVAGNVFIYETRRLYRGFARHFKRQRQRGEKRRERAGWLYMSAKVSRNMHHSGRWEKRKVSGRSLM